MHRFARRVKDHMKTSMDRQRHRRESPILGLTAKFMGVFLIVAGLFLLINTFGSSASLVQNLPDSDVGLGTVVVERPGTSTYHQSISERRLLQVNPPPPGSPGNSGGKSNHPGYVIGRLFAFLAHNVREEDDHLRMIS